MMKGDIDTKDFLSLNIMKFIQVSFLVLILSPYVFSQWQVSGAFNIKSEIPQKGISINVIRKLPVQLAFFGFSVRGEINIFRQKEMTDNLQKKYSLDEYHLDIICSMFLRNFTPYAGFGFGFGELNANRLNKGSVLLNLFAGLNLSLIELISPYLEIQCVNYFSDFDSALSGKNISSLQIRGMIGISILISSL